MIVDFQLLKGNKYTVLNQIQYSIDMTQKKSSNDPSVKIANRRAELNAEYVRLVKLRDQIIPTLQNINVSLAELDRIESESTEPTTD